MGLSELQELMQKRSWSVPDTATHAPPYLLEEEIPPALADDHANDPPPSPTLSASPSVPSLPPSPILAPLNEVNEVPALLNEVINGAEDEQAVGNNQEN
jgi:hypothetical protein